MSRFYKIAVDGFSSCGKSTIAKQLADRLNFLYVDTGAMYRALTLYVIENQLINGDVVDVDMIINLLSQIVIDFSVDVDGRPVTLLNGRNVESEIRRMEVSSKVSVVSAIPLIRKHLVAMQRRLAEGRSVVMDGRDIGTVVFPDADVKIFVTADVDIRARRRYLELKERGREVSLEVIKRNIEQRDKIDSTRADSPLRRADDAVLLDNSHMSRQQQLDFALQLVKKVVDEH